MASPGSLARAAARLKPAYTRKGQAVPKAWLVSDPVRLPDPAPVLAGMSRGSALIWRPYGMDRRAALAQGRGLRRIARQRGVLFLVAGDPQLAAAVGADGLHLPEGLARHGVLAPALLWRASGTGRWLSVACHGARALGRARALGADVALLSPVFVTASHPGARGLGALPFAWMARRAGLPVVALGGVTAVTAPRLSPGSAAGLAGISGFGLCGAPVSV